MAEPTTPASSPTPEQPLIDRAVQVCREVAARQLRTNLQIEAVSHFEEWNDLRRRFSVHLLVWQYITTMTIAVDGQGNLAGWYTEKRKAGGGPDSLPAVAAEVLAKTDALLTPAYQMRGAEKVPVDDANCYTKCTFVAESPSRTLEVLINPATKDLIGVMPPEATPSKPLPADDSMAAKAEALAWKQIEDNARSKIGQSAADHIREAVKMTFKQGTVDAGGIKRFVFASWSYFSEADVFLDAVSKQTLGWNIPGFSSPAPDKAIDEKKAGELARVELLARQEVVGPDVSFTAYNKDQAAVVHWQHVIDGIPISGDFTTVMLNATTGTPFSVSRKWREIPHSMLEGKTITDGQALAAAEGQRKALGIGDQAKGKVLGKAVVEIAANRDQPSPVRNVLVWRVGYKTPNRPEYTEVYVDANTGAVVDTTGW